MPDRTTAAGLGPLFLLCRAGIFVGVAENRGKSYLLSPASHIAELARRCSIALHPGVDAVVRCCTKSLKHDVVRFTTVADVRLKILEALNTDLIHPADAEAADAKTQGATAAGLKAVSEQLEALITTKMS